MRLVQKILGANPESRVVFSSGEGRSADFLQSLQGLVNSASRAGVLVLPNSVADGKPVLSLSALEAALTQKRYSWTHLKVFSSDEVLIDSSGLAAGSPLKQALFILISQAMISRLDFDRISQISIQRLYSSHA